MHKLLTFSKIPYIQHQNLKPLLQDYSNPDDFISRLVKSGELIRLKNGFYLINEKIKDSPIPFEQIANSLYGPSYVSFEWALSYYNMIPEGVYVVTSACLNRSKVFSTPVGVFEYFYLNKERYAVGIKQNENELGKFLIASPEKALVDLIHLKSKQLNAKELLVDLIEGRRMDEETLKNLDKKHLLEIADRYHSKVIINLINVLGML